MKNMVDDFEFLALFSALEFVGWLRPRPSSSSFVLEKAVP